MELLNHFNRFEFFIFAAGLLWLLASGLAKLAKNAIREIRKLGFRRNVLAAERHPLESL